MAPYEKAWHEGFALVLPAAGRTRLRAALEHNDNRLVQRHAACPVGSPNYPCAAADAIGFAVWSPGDTVAQVGLRWVNAFTEAYRLTGDAASFVVWYDTTPRDEMRRTLMRMIDAGLACTCGREAVQVEGGAPWCGRHPQTKECV